MKWQEMGPEERWQIVELALSGKAKTSELCKTFGMSSATLYAAMDKVRTAAVEALAPRKAGRKPRTVDEEAIEKLESKNGDLVKEAKEWKTKYEVTRAVLDLERKYDRGELKGAGKKKSRRQRRKEKRQAPVGPS